MTKTAPAAKTKFKRDSYARARLFHPDSFKHNGKANLNLISTLLQYVPAGDLVIDPMGGTGSILIATSKKPFRLWTGKEKQGVNL